MSCIKCSGAYPQDEEDRREMEDAMYSCDCNGYTSQDKAEKEYRLREARREAERD